MNIRRFTLTCICILVTTISFADEQNVNPTINQHYLNPDFDTWVERFERDGREVYDYRKQIVSTLKLKPDNVIADIGAGTGLFTRLFARAVPQGKVYAVDISKTFIDNIIRSAHAQNLHNIDGIINTQHSVNLPVNSIDMAFTSDTYHHFEYPQTMLSSIHQALKSGGRLVIIDFRKDPQVSSNWVMGHTRANKQQVIKEVSRAGFKLLREHDLLTENFFLEFTKQ